MKIFTDRASLDGRYRKLYARLPEEKTLLPQTPRGPADILLFLNHESFAVENLVLEITGLLQFHQPFIPIGFEKIKTF